MDNKIVVIEMCDRHMVPMVGYLRKFCTLCKKDTEGNRKGKHMYTFSRTLLSKKGQNELVQIAGVVASSMYLDGGKRVIAEIIVGLEKIRVVIAHGNLIREFRTAKEVVLYGTVRHDVERNGETCDEILVASLKDIT